MLPFCPLLNLWLQIILFASSSHLSSLSSIEFGPNLIKGNSNFGQYKFSIQSNLTFYNHFVLFLFKHFSFTNDWIRPNSCRSLILGLFYFFEILSLIYVWFIQENKTIQMKQINKAINGIMFY